MKAELIFSNKYFSLFVPGIGIICYPFDNNHANATWPAVALIEIANCFNYYTFLLFSFNESSYHLGNSNRISLESKVSLFTVPVNIPYPRGL